MIFLKLILVIQIYLNPENLALGSVILVMIETKCLQTITFDTTHDLH